MFLLSGRTKFQSSRYVSLNVLDQIALVLQDAAGFTESEPI
jgi:hypothetical protein